MWIWIANSISCFFIRKKKKKAFSHSCLADCMENMPRRPWNLLIVSTLSLTFSNTPTLPPNLNSNASWVLHPASINDGYKYPSSFFSQEMAWLFVVWASFVTSEKREREREWGWRVISLCSNVPVWWPVFAASDLLKTTWNQNGLCLLSKCTFLVLLWTTYCHTLFQINIVKLYLVTL